MFEVGKLTDESLDSFLVELGKVRSRGMLMAYIPAWSPR